VQNRLDSLIFLPTRTGSEGHRVETIRGAGLEAVAF